MYLKYTVAPSKLVLIALVTAACLAQQASDPWSKDELLEAPAFAASLGKSAKPAKIICVAFPVLYRQRHIAGAVYAGPGNKPEGLEALKKEVAGLAKNSDIVLYCGCCPMDRCPNIRPSYRTLKEMGFTSVRILNIPDNMHNNWYTKGYPSDPPLPPR
jgi:thiosulfate/3-mercaptopyruvate sulfurtransferase